MTSGTNLTQDLEHAVQQAIGQAINVGNTLSSDLLASGKSKKRKKLSAEASDVLVQSGLKKKRKQKEAKSQEPDAGFLSENATALSQSHDAKSKAHSHKKKRREGRHTAPSIQSSPELQSINIDPALQNIRSTLPTNELAAALTNATAHQMEPFTVPSLQELFGGSVDGSEDLLRVLSELDLPKIAGVLKTFGETSTGVSMPLQTTFSPAMSQQLSHNTYSADLPAPTTQDTSTDPTSLNWTSNSDDHAYLLANRWYNTSKLAQLEQSEGLIYKKGKFSAIEDEQLVHAIANYRVARALSDEELLAIIKKESDGSKDKSDSTFWFEITAQVPLRPVMSVYHHVRRMYDSKRHQGKWLPEEDRVLEQSVIDLGLRWEKVGARVGRTASDCRDRWRNHINHRETRISGPWTREEEEELTKIVQSMTVDKGLSPDGDVFWGQVSDRMNNRRTRQQCRIKWTDALNKTVKNRGEKPRWSQQDAYILVYKVASLDVNDDTEIDWRNLNDSDWNLWSSHQLQRRWQTLKKGIKGYESMAFQEIAEILKAKKGQAPPSSIKKLHSGRRGNISSRFVTEEDAAEDVPALPGPTADP